MVDLRVASFLRSLEKEVAAHGVLGPQVVVRVDHLSHFLGYAYGHLHASETVVSKIVLDPELDHESTYLDESLRCSELELHALG